MNARIQGLLTQLEMGPHKPRVDRSKMWRAIINANPNLALDCFEQLKEECMGFAPCVMSLAWRMTLIQSGRELAPPPRLVTSH